MNVEENKLSVYITEEGFELDYITEENLNDEENALLSLYQKNKFEFLVELAFVKEQELSISLTFLQYIARTFLQATANDPKFNFSKTPFDCEINESTICNIIENAPYIIGLEFVNKEWVLNILLSNIYNANDRTIDESMISDIFGIELGSLSDTPIFNEEIDDTPKTVDVVRVIEIKPSTSVAHVDKPETVIRQYNLDGIFMNQFDSYEEATYKTHIHRNLIREACNGRIEIAGEYQWRIADSTDAKINITKYIPPIDYSLLINCPIQQLDTRGNLVEEFVSAVEASRKTNISINWIRDALSGRQQQAGGFVWKLLDTIEKDPSQEVVSAYQRQNIIRIRQENYQHQNVKEQHQERLQTETQKQEQDRQKELLRKQEKIRKQRESDETQCREEARKKQEKIDRQKASYRKQGLCQHCGGTFKKKFLFFTSNICSRCGMKKDY